MGSLDYLKRFKVHLNKLGTKPDDLIKVLDAKAAEAKENGDWWSERDAEHAALLYYGQLLAFQEMANELRVAE